eukprot:RCo003282
MQMERSRAASLRHPFAAAWVEEATASAFPFGLASPLPGKAGEEEEDDGLWDSLPSSPANSVGTSCFSYGSARPAARTLTPTGLEMCQVYDLPSEGLSCAATGPYCHNPYASTPTSEQPTPLTFSPLHRPSAPVAIPGSSQKQRRAMMRTVSSSSSFGGFGGPTPLALPEPVVERKVEPASSAQSSRATPQPVGDPAPELEGSPSTLHLRRALAPLLSLKGTGHAVPMDLLKQAEEVHQLMEITQRALTNLVAQVELQQRLDAVSGADSTSRSSATASTPVSSHSASSRFSREACSISSSSFSPPPLSQAPALPRSQASQRTPTAAAAEVSPQLLQSVISVPTDDPAVSASGASAPGLRQTGGGPGPREKRDCSLIVCKDFLLGTCEQKRWKCKYLHPPMLRPDAELPPRPAGSLSTPIDLGVLSPSQRGNCHGFDGPSSAHHTPTQCIGLGSHFHSQTAEGKCER